MYILYIYVYPLMMSHDNLQIEFTPFLLSKLKFCTLFLDRRFNYNKKLVSLIFAKNIEGEISNRRLQLAQDSSCFMSGSSEIENIIQLIRYSVGLSRNFFITHHHLPL